MDNQPPIYVESFIACSVEDVWSRTQTPDVHQRWDVRFTRIEYLPRPNPTEPQRFLYATTIGPGLVVSGQGETLGERHRNDGTAYSGLRFWSDHPLSLIHHGSGYWRYVPADDGVRFLTRYDYHVRWGAFGRMVDGIFFRRLFGWGTAWSFDRLRLWIERGITPEESLRRTLAFALTVLVVAGSLVAIAIAGSQPPLLALTTVSLAAFARAAGHERPSGRTPLRHRRRSDETALGSVTPLTSKLS